MNQTLSGGVLWVEKLAWTFDFSQQDLRQAQFVCYYYPSLKKTKMFHENTMIFFKALKKLTK